MTLFHTTSWDVANQTPRHHCSDLLGITPLTTKQQYINIEPVSITPLQDPCYCTKVSLEDSNRRPLNPECYEYLNMLVETKTHLIVVSFEHIVMVRTLF